MISPTTTVAGTVAERVIVPLSVLYDVESTVTASDVSLRMLVMIVVTLAI